MAAINAKALCSRESDTTRSSSRSSTMPQRKTAPILIPKTCRSLRLPLALLLAGVLPPGLTAGGGEGPGYVLETQWGEFGAGPGQFKFPCMIAVDADSNVYVVDQ